ncbi:autotransporter domain-containing protein [Bradyrhizobium barranii subsp. apii]|uniref:autotransporter outer membrane beta-barrel domain-containing protein n=1 Tax=Bradyrhizobium barranii TaxID=2992140 RepID=UPI001CD7156B|nr:autotransporter domain-containing protein [Bradyrhizobium barranii]UPT95314.1 autotransporter domain-containing protein [Bradyrhizobium barranii subsp. apii]
MTPRNIVRATTSRRRAVLLSTAIGALGSSLPWFIMPAEAACVITGAGSQTALQSGDSITCIGMGNTLVRTASGVSGVTVNVGDGSPTSLNDPALAGIVFDTTSNSAIKVLGNASVAPANSDGIIVSGGGNNTITVDAGAAIGSPTVGTTALGLAGSNNNIVLIGGTVGSGAAGTAGIGIFGGSAGNQVNILSSGIVQGNGPAAIDLNGAASGNTINNAGTISNASGTAIFGSNNQDTIINSGAISSNGVSIAVDLKDGNDVFELRAGSNITGWVVGGNGADTLRLGGTANAAFDLSTFGASNQFREFEALEKTGSSTWTLNGSTTEIASMNVLAGTVEVNGSMPNIATTVSAGILSGNGAIGNITVLSGGTVLPGNLGTLTSSGNVTFNAGSTYAISVTATGQSEKILAVSAALNGGTVAVNTIAGAYNPSTQYTILSTTTGVTGSFSGVTVSGYNPQLFASSLSYDGFSVFLTLNYNNAAFLSLAQTQNQKAVAGALSAFGPNLPFLSSFAGQSDAQLRYSLDQLSGEAATGAQQGAFQFTSQFLGLMLDPFVGGRSGMSTGDTAFGFSPERAALPDDIALAYNKVLGTPAVKAPAFAERWTAWGTAFGGTNRTSGDPVMIGSHDLGARAGGVAAGADYHFGHDALVGFALSGGGTKWDLAQAIGGGKSDAIQAGVYTAVRTGPAYFAASLAVANHWMSTDRLAPFGNQLTAKFDAQTVGGRIEGGYRFATPIGGLTPYVAAQAQAFRTPTYTEADLAGSGFGLTYRGRTASDTRSELGARFDRATLVTPNSVLTLRGRAAWAHDWVSDPTLVAAFQALPGASFIVNGATPAKDTALASAGAELKFSNGVALSAKFDGEFAARSTTYSGTASLRYAW